MLLNKSAKELNLLKLSFVTAYQEYLPYTVSRRIEPFDYISKGEKIESIADRLRIDIDEAYARYQNYMNSNQKHQEKFTYEPTHGVKRQVDFENLYYIESVKIQIDGYELWEKIFGLNIEAS